MDARQWFREAKFGLMVHWGLYSLPAGEWKGQRMTYIGEWIQSRFRIPNAEYHALARAFNPILFDADEWVRLAQDAGMQYIVVTAKHHEGFALFRSKVSSFNLADATPFGRDAIDELANACARRGMKLGLYYSQDLDWHDPNGGGYLSKHIPSQGVTWENSWDFPDTAHKNFDLCFENKIYPQVEELLRNYGDLCLIWFDMPMTLKENQSRALFEAIKKYQPDCLINSRLGNGAYDYVSLGDNEIPDSMPENVEFDPSLMNGIDGFKPSPYGLYETAATMNDSWGFCARDQHWKDAAVIAANKKKLNSMGINYLLNVGPDGLGRIPLASQKILREVAKTL